MSEGGEILDLSVFDWIEKSHFYFYDDLFYCWGVINYIFIVA